MIKNIEEFDDIEEKFFNYMGKRRKSTDINNGDLTDNAIEDIELPHESTFGAAIQHRFVAQPLPMALFNIAKDDRHDSNLTYASPSKYKK